MTDGVATNPQEPGDPAVLEYEPPTQAAPEPPSRVAATLFFVGLMAVALAGMVALVAGVLAALSAG